MKWGISGMQSKMSLFNREMILQVGRNVGWISVIYFLGLFFVIPLRIMMNYSGDDYQYFKPIHSIFDLEFGIQFMMYITVPVILAVFLYRFLHVKAAADLMHSLPLKREKIYQFYTLTGFAYLILPVIVIALISIFVHSIYDLNLYFQLEDIWRWTGTVILFNTVLYMAGVFVAMVTGISVVHGVLTYIMLLFPAGFTLLIIYNLGLTLYGFPSDYFQIRNIEKLSPITHLSLMESQNLSFKGILIYSVFLISFYILSLILYKRRKIEAASEAIAFFSLKVIFKYGVAFCMMLLGGMYFDAMQNKFGWLLFGYAAGGTIGYFAAEMVLQKTWRVFGHIRGLGIFGVAVVIFVLIIQAFAPYEKRVPELEKIKSVTYTNMIYSGLDEDQAAKPLKELENIKAVRNLHADIIKNEKRNELDMKSTEFALFIYELENGTRMVRQYSIDRLDYVNHLKKINESLEYKHANNPIFKVKSDEVVSIRIINGSKDNNLIISYPDKIKEAMDILKKETVMDPYDSDYYPRGNRSTVEIQAGKDDYVHTELKQSYSLMIAWLKNNDMLEQALVMPEDLEYILVTNEAIKEDQFKEFPEAEIQETLEANENTLKLTDRDDLQAAIENAGYGWFNEEPYTAIFVYKSGNRKEIRTFSEKHVPDFIKEHFK
jgi:ABC-2 type transport system permease protein